jgi:hypothetical protein
LMLKIFLRHKKNIPVAVPVLIKDNLFFPAIFWFKQYRVLLFSFIYLVMC